MDIKRELEHVIVLMRLIVAFTILLLGGRIAEYQTPPFGNCSTLAPLQRTWRALLGVLSGPVLERLGGTPRLFPPQVDGGGDGGGGDGGDGGGDGGTGGAGDGAGGAGTSSDGSAGGDSGTGVGNSGDSNSDGNGDGPSADPGAVGAPGDPGSTEDAPANDAEAPPDPSAVTAVANPEDVADVPTNDPALGLRGPGSSGSGTENSVAPSSASPLRASPFQPSSGPVSGASVDVGINAVIVSGARTPWEAIGKGPGVANVIVTGGVIALGETAFEKLPPGVSVGAADNPPRWLEFKPDLRYLDGSVFPPVVPNVIDIRTISNTEEAVLKPPN